MSDDKVTGGPAFPAHVAEIHGVATNSSDFNMPGMTLRDYFAAAALIGMQAHPANERPLHVATWAYEVADAMLAEREK